MSFISISKVSFPSAVNYCLETKDISFIPIIKSLIFFFKGSIYFSVFYLPDSGEKKSVFVQGEIIFNTNNNNLYQNSLVIVVSSVAYTRMMFWG